jgi:hypothetical protein
MLVRLIISRNAPADGTKKEIVLVSPHVTEISKSSQYLIGHWSRRRIGRWSRRRIGRWSRRRIGRWSRCRIGHWSRS